MSRRQNTNATTTRNESRSESRLNRGRGLLAGCLAVLLTVPPGALAGESEAKDDTMASIAGDATASASPTRPVSDAGLPPRGASHGSVTGGATLVSGPSAPATPGEAKSGSTSGEYRSNSPAQSQADAGLRRLSFSSGSIEPDRGIDPRVVTESIALAATGRERLYGFLIVNQRLDDARRQALAELGVDVIGRHSRTFKVSLPTSRDALEEIQMLPFVEWIGMSTRQQKVDLDLQIARRDAEVDATFRLFVNLFDEDDGRFRQQLEKVGATVGAYDADLRAYTVTASSAAIDRIVAEDRVLFVEPVKAIKGLHDQSMAMMGADYVRVGGSGSRYDGSSVDLGVMDTGFMAGSPAPTPHQDLNKFTCGRNFTDDAAGVWNDEDGHGTHVLGTIVGTGTADARYRGVAPGIGETGTNRIRLAKMLDRNGDGTVEWAEEAMDYLGQSSDCNEGSSRPHIVSASFGLSGAAQVGTDAQSRKLDTKVWDFGQLYVVAAGNDGAGQTVNSPGTAKNALTVGSVLDSGYTTAGDIASTSSGGDTGDGRMKPNLVAPGQWVRSARAGTTDQYISMAGTSMATPHVAGLAATLLDHYPSLKFRSAATRSRLMASALLHDDDTTPSEPDFWDSNGRTRYGLGRVSSYASHWGHGGADGWSWNTFWRDVDDSSWEGADIDVPSGTRRLVVVMTWDEPAASAGAERAVVYDLDLWVDRDADCTSTDGRCGEYQSESIVDNVEYLIIDNPPAGTYRLKAVPYDAPSFDLPVGISATIIRGDTTPDITLDVTSETVAPAVGESFTVTATVENPTYIASGVQLKLDPLPSGVVLEDVEVTLKDGTEFNMGPTTALSLGNIISGDSRSARLTFRTTTPGIRTLTFRAWSENGGERSETLDLCTPDAYEPDDSAGQSSPLGSAPQTHNICPGTDRDWARFTLDRPSAVVLQTTGAVGDTRMWLRDGSLAEVEFDDDDGAELFSRIDRACESDPLPAGTYYVEIDEYGNNSNIASYQLSLQVEPCPCVPDAFEVDDTPGQASLLTDSAFQLHNICESGDQDWAVFTVDAPSSVVVQTQGASGDTRLWLHDSAMTEVGFDDDGGSGLFSRIERSCGDPLMPGTYFVKVDEYNGIFEIDSYSLHLGIAACPVQGAGSVPATGAPLTATRGSGESVQLQWGQSCNAADSDYSIYEGTLGSFSSHTMKLCSTGGATTAEIETAAGHSSYFLVVPNNGTWEGGYGRDSSGVARSPGLSQCLPQAAATCQ